MTTKNTGKRIYHLQSDGTTVKFMKNPENPISMAGNRKFQVEPVKQIEVAYEKAGGNMNEPAFYVLDHVTIRSEKGGYQDLDISDFKGRHLLKENKYSESKARADYNGFLSNAMKEMNKAGYYSFSGKGDNDRIYWVKYNPQVESMSKCYF